MSSTTPEERHAKDSAHFRAWYAGGVNFPAPEYVWHAALHQGRLSSDAAAVVAEEIAAWRLRALQAEARVEGLEFDLRNEKAGNASACHTVAQMHEAATGRHGEGPKRGVVEDVEDVRLRAEELEVALTASRENCDAWAKASNEADNRLKLSLSQNETLRKALEHARDRLLSHLQSALNQPHDVAALKIISDALSGSTPEWESQDTLRLDWLQRFCVSTSFSSRIDEFIVQRHEQVVGNMAHSPKLRDAIDAAMSASAKGGPTP